MPFSKNVVAVGLLLCVGAGLAAQSPSATTGTLPASLALTDVEIALVRNTGGGCGSGRCIHYRVTIRGDGTVMYEDLAAPPVPPRSRRIPADDVLALTNEFVGARFFEVPERYAGKSFYVRQDEQLSLRGTGGADGASWDLSLRLGGFRKSVYLYQHFPDHLRNLRDRVDQIGGPKAWTAR
jgi:hypothetical protein